MSALDDQTIRFQPEPAGAGRAEHYLTVVEGGSQRSIALTREPLILGRDPTLPFCLPDGGVSRAHCEVRLVASFVLVSDLGSMNGTRVDGVEVKEETPLPPSSLLQIGPFVLRHEVLMPEEVARRKELASDLDRARRYVEELIPPPLASGPVRAEWGYFPSSVLGGDGLGYVHLEGGHTGFYVIDVCGHGAGSALHSASVLNTLRAQTLPGADFHDPASVLEQLARAFAMENHSGMFFSMWYGVLDHSTGRLRYASAGHPPALLVGTDQRIRERLATQNAPVGTVEGKPVRAAEAQLANGESVYVFSDGVFEIVYPDGGQGSLEDFERIVAEPDRGAVGEPQRLHDAVCALAGAPLDDDFTVLVITFQA